MESWDVLILGLRKQKGREYNIVSNMTFIPQFKRKCIDLQK